MKSYLLGFWFLLFPFVIAPILGFELTEDDSLLTFGSVIIGVVFLATAIKQSSANAKLEEQLKKITSNLELISSKIDKGKSLEEISNELREKENIPEIMTIKLTNYIIQQYIEDNLIPEIVNENIDKIGNKLSILEILSYPFKNNVQNFKEEIKNLNENTNVYYLLQDVMITEKGENKKNLGSGTLIITTRYLFWFPNKITFDYIFKNDKIRNASGKLLNNVPFLGLGLNSILLVDSLNNTFSEKKIFDDKKINELLEIANTNDKFIAIKLSDICSIEFPFKWTQRIKKQSFTIKNRENREFELSSFNKRLEFVDDMFEQIRMVCLLHNNIMLPENLNNPTKWFVWK